jgi:prepilin-type N-terminal cleavage/methylation domain-containing protein
MKKNGFTLIEILVVVVILGILMAILVPVVGGAGKTAKKRRAQVEVNSIKTAVLQFVDEYRYMPWWQGEKGEKVGADVSSKGSDEIHARVMDILLGNNVLKKAYLSFPESQDDKELFRDPWGNPYILILDRDLDGIALYNGVKIRERVLVYSPGPDGQEATGDEILSFVEPK